jgi:glycosyltransferase involved in cell wall biosynthesis
MIPPYNSARYLRESLASVLDQDLGLDVMQIEVVDDHSTQDDPAVIVEELGRGRVGFYRQRENVGQVRNYETCLNRSRGKLIHML